MGATGARHLAHSKRPVSQDRAGARWSERGGQGPACLGQVGPNGVPQTDLQACSVLGFSTGLLGWLVDDW